jgi:hypothetical protein
MSIYLYMKTRKREKRKRKSNSWLSGPGGFSAQPSARARRGDDAMGVGPHASEGERNSVTGGGGGGGRRSACGGEEPAAGDLGGGSPPVIRFWVVGEVAQHE